MLTLAPLLFLILSGFATWQFSAWQTARALDAQSRPLEDRELAHFLRRLAAALQVPQIKVYLYEVAPINGLAAPDGRIFLTRGFYDAFRQGAVTAEEIASVVAHELGHVALGHARRRMLDFSGQNAMRMVLATVLGRVLPGIGPMLAGGLMQLVAAKLSRADEYEADAYAAALLTKAGIGVAPQKSLLRKLGRLTGGSGAGMPAWLMSHPLTEERIAALEALEDRWHQRG